MVAGLLIERRSIVFGPKLLVLLLFLAAANVFAVEPPYGAVWGYSRNVKYQVAVQGFSSPDIKVSGTKVEFTVRADFPPRLPEEPYSGQDTWQFAKIVELKVWIGNHLIGTFAPQELLNQFTKNIRFASTHFPDGTSVQLKAQAKFAFSEDGTIWSDPVTLGPSVVTVIAYNKATTWATAVLSNGMPDPSHQVPIVSLAIANLAVSKLNGMNHEVLRSTNLEQTQKSDILNRIALTTFVFACTHGFPTSFWDSTTSNVTFSPFQNNDVRQAVGERYGETPEPGKLPSHNLVILYACNTLHNQGNGSWHGAFSFGVGGIGSITPNRAYLGFSQVVWAETLAGKPLTEHANILLTRLAAGDTVEQALKSANETVRPKNSDGGALSISYPGDRHTRIMGVYTGQGAHMGWYIFLD